MTNLTHLQIPSLIAHRGARTLAPENTLTAFAIAREQGLSWIECDILLSQDRIPVIMHDEMVNRTTDGQGLVRNLTFAQLRALRTAPGIPIPSLTDTLQWLTQHSLHANLEIKTATHHDAPIELLTGEPLDLLENRRNAELSCNTLRSFLQQGSDFLISSFCMEALRQARKVLPTVPIGMLLEIHRWSEEWPRKRAVIEATYRELNAYSLHINNSAVTAHTLPELLAISPRILVYTVNDQQRAQWLLQHGVTAVFTDSLTPAVINTRRGGPACPPA